MCAAVTKPDSEQLFEITEAQQGYFTAGQAVEAGYARSTHSYHVDAGNWLREYRGIYRLRRYPQSDDGHLVPERRHFLREPVSRFGAQALVRRSSSDATVAHA